MIDWKIRQAWQDAFDYYSHQQLLIKFDIKRAKMKKIPMIQTGFAGMNNKLASRVPSI